MPENINDNLPTTNGRNTNTIGSMDASEFLSKLISNKHVPNEIAHQFWVLFSMSSKITFLNEKDVKRKMMEFELLRLTFIKSIPKKEYNSAIKSMLTSIQMEFYFNLKRSCGNGRMNERELQASSTTAVFAERPLTPEHSANGGIISNFMGLFGGSKK